MALPTPTVPSITFNSGNEAKLYLQDITTYDSTVGLTTSNQLTVVGADINFTPTGSVESLPIYGSTWDRAVKNGISGSFNALTYAPGGNTQVALLLTAGQGVGQIAGIVYVLELPDGGYAHGAAVVNEWTPNTPVRGVFSYSFNFTTDGPVVYVAPA